MKLLTGVLLLCFVSPLYAKGSVLQIQRNLRMSHSDPVPDKLFFVDLGSKDGMKEGDLLWVQRSIPVVNVAAGTAEEILLVRVGQLKITHVGEHTAMAEGLPFHGPGLRGETILVGDSVQSVSVMKR